MHKSFLKNLPDYFQMELEGQQLAFVQGLDSLLQSFGQNQLSAAASMSLLGTQVQRLREDLKLLGFASETLEQDKLILFSRIRHELLAHAGSLKGVGRLLDVYFPGASVQRGRTYSRKSLNAATRFRLSDRRERREVVSITLQQVPDSEKVSEFLANCRRLVPMEVHVEVRVLAKASPPPKGWNLSQRRTGGRLSCRTSLN